MAVWLEIIVRTLVAVVVLFGLTKLLGKRQISQLSLFEYITGITIGDLAATVSIDVNSDWYLGMIAMAVWASISLGIEFIQIKSKKGRNFIDGSSTVLIQNGKILEDNLKKEKLTNEELLEQLRKKNVFKAAEVEFALIEPDGEINVLLKKEYQPITPSHLGIKVAPEPEPQAVILDGEIMDEPLATLGFNRQWLNTELQKLGVTLDNVYLGQVDGYGQFYVDLYDDLLQVPEPQEKPYLLAQLKKCEADLEMFALSIKDPIGKKMYGDCSTQMIQIINQVKPILSQ
ncbi:DUF421 domain-containing protein [Paenibacillus segetis]|uniref:YetF C-terminal domain-containing protein n=1 Tax=Paenibacillus segetis TaxID=1325360 RepID=A0ABQ1YAD6_9BACL|nr:DUF421 domain-containing protein [Paenibacillus segetis]GGH18143.1 hypothetical protein GCM10008013_13910 [Paenibacillus segetis]